MIHLIAVLLGALLVFGLLFLVLVFNKFGIKLEEFLLWSLITIASLLILYMIGSLILLAFFGIDLGVWAQ